MSSPLPPRTEIEIAAHTAHLAGDVVLQHPLAQVLTYTTVEALLAVARQDPGLNQETARLFVRAALAACIEAEILACREGWQ